jgi:hypothetical protein
VWPSFVTAPTEADLVVSPGTAKPFHWGILLFRNNGWTEIAFKHTALETLLLTFDPVLPIDSLKFFRHLLYNLEDPDLRPNGLEFNGLPDRKLVRHVPNPSYFLRLIAHSSNHRVDFRSGSAATSAQFHCDGQPEVKKAAQPQYPTER